MLLWRNVANYLKISLIPLLIWSTVVVLANSADPDQTALKEQSDLGLHCLLR